MFDLFNYTGSINQKYTYRKYNSQLSNINYGEIDVNIDINCQVTAYAFSPVDQYGAQALCWHNDLSNDLTTIVKASADLALSVDEKFGSAWSQISAIAIADADKTKAKGWLTVNTRYLNK